MVIGDGVFHTDKSIIYHTSLDLKKENQGETSADILDLTIKLDSNLFSYKLYDKRDHFNFDIVNYPDLKGNISMNCGYGVVKSELKRYAKLSSNFSDYILRKDILFRKVLEKNYNSNKIELISHTVSFK